MAGTRTGPVSNGRVKKKGWGQKKRGVGGGGGGGGGGRPKAHGFRHRKRGRVDVKAGTMKKKNKPKGGKC